MASAEFLGEMIDQSIHRDPILFHRVPVPHGDCLSSSVSKSTVTAYGVPISSCLRYAARSIG